MNNYEMLFRMAGVLKPIERLLPISSSVDYKNAFNTAQTNVVVYRKIGFVIKNT